MKKPLDNPMENAPFNGQATWDGVYLGNFNENTVCTDVINYSIYPNINGSDYIVMATFKNISKSNIGAKSLAYLRAPPTGWANPTDCGDFPCTAPKNIIVKDLDGTLIDEEFPGVLIYNNPGIADSTMCTVHADWNAYKCVYKTSVDRHYAHLVFESNDGDTLDRSI
jgi:hypothetical protein